MTNHNEELVRQAYQAYTRGDLSGLLDLVDPDLEWTYLDPAFADPTPATCHGRDQLRAALQRQADQGLAAELDEVVASGDTVLVVVHQPGLDRVEAGALAGLNPDS
jgi:ketosteroid isomerase-like protein